MKLFPGDRMDTQNWYVLYVSGGKEARLISFLKEQGMQSFTPMMERIHKKQGEYQKIIVPMFPNYIFVISSLDQKDFNEQLLKLKQMKSGIIKQLMYDKEGTSALLPLEKELLESLMDECYLVRHSKAIMEGDAIIVTEGPLMGMESRIKRIDRHKRLAYLECELLGKKVKISLEVVRKVEEPFTVKCEE